MAFSTERSLHVARVTLESLERLLGSEIRQSAHLHVLRQGSAAPLPYFVCHGAEAGPVSFTSQVRMARARRRAVHAARENVELWPCPDLSGIAEHFPFLRTGHPRRPGHRHASRHCRRWSGEGRGQRRCRVLIYRHAYVECRKGLCCCCHPIPLCAGDMTSVQVLVYACHGACLAAPQPRAHPQPAGRACAVCYRHVPHER